MITRYELKDKTKREALVEARLNDMGLGAVTERENGVELREAARLYFMGLIEEDLANSNDVLLKDCLNSAEGMTLGFVAGYEACLRNHDRK